MCSGFDITLGEINVNLSEIYAYQVGELVSRNFAATSELPEIKYDGSIDNAEEQLIRCFIDNATGRSEAALDRLKDDGNELVIREDELFDNSTTPPKPVAGEWDDDSFNNAREIITLNRKEIKSNADELSNTTNDSHKRITYSKQFLSTFVHELCHSLLAPATHPGGVIDFHDTSYWGTQFGICEKNMFKEVIGEFPSDHKEAFNQPQSFVTSACISTAIINNIVFFDSIDSQAAASAQYPTFSVEYYPYHKP
jgi:hypothetical protein